MSGFMTTVDFVFKIKLFCVLPKDLILYVRAIFIETPWKRIQFFPINFIHTAIALKAFQF